MIWIRPSQIKIKYGLPKDTAITGLSPAHYSLDLVSYARVTSPAHFSKLLIHNLYHNGVPLDALAELMKKSLELELVPLMDWDGDEAMQRLWDTVDRVGNIHSMSAHDDAKGMERALGFGRRVGKTLDVVQDVEDDTISKRYFPGGKPIFGGELCMQMLQAGFKPQDELFLYDELRKVMRNKADRDIKRFHVAIVNSFEAPFVAGESISFYPQVILVTIGRKDPFGQLQEDEIAFTSSTRIFGTDQDRFTLRGDVLVSSVATNNLSSSELAPRCFVTPLVLHQTCARYAIGRCSCQRFRQLSLLSTCIMEGQGCDKSNVRRLPRCNHSPNELENIVS